jgi:hypothetical protein
MRSTIEMAGEVWQSGTGRYTGTASIGELKRFEALVRADERKIVMNEPLTKEMWQRFEDEIRADEREQGQKWFDAVTAQHRVMILAEREACAKVCEDQKYMILEPLRTYSAHDICDANKRTALYLSKAIRARGETK